MRSQPLPKARDMEARQAATSGKDWKPQDVCAACLQSCCQAFQETGCCKIFSTCWTQGGVAARFAAVPGFFAGIGKSRNRNVALDRMGTGSPGAEGSSRKAGAGAENPSLKRDAARQLE